MARGVSSSGAGGASAAPQDDGSRSSPSPLLPSVVLVLGGPGSGKSSVCERIGLEMGYKHLSAGQLLRTEAQNGDSALAASIRAAFVSGGVVPSNVMVDLLDRAMRECDRGGTETASFVLDGYPRSAEQLAGWAATLSSRVRLLSCLYLEVDLETMQRRLRGRAGTSGRLDDNEATMQRRFETYLKETQPLLEHFQSRGVLRRIDGGRSLDEVWGTVKAAVLASQKEAAEEAVS